MKMLIRAGLALALGAGALAAAPKAALAGPKCPQTSPPPNGFKCGEEFTGRRYICAQPNGDEVVADAGCYDPQGDCTSNGYDEHSVYYKCSIEQDDGTFKDGSCPYVTYEETAFFCI